MPVFTDPVPHSTRQYRLILTQYLLVPLIIHHFVRHSSLISPFMIHLMSHAQYTWSSYPLIFAFVFVFFLSFCFICFRDQTSGTETFFFETKFSQIDIETFFVTNFQRPKTKTLKKIWQMSRNRDVTLCL